MARVRSPNYPQLDLAEAISRVAQVFAKDHKHLAPKEVVVQHLGYSGLNGAALGALSALDKYGLLERDGEKYRVSARAIEILHPESPEKKAAAVRDAALAPALYADLAAEFPDSPPSDENLKALLIRRGFAPSALTRVIEIYRKTMDLVQSVVNNAGRSAVGVTKVPPVQPSTIVHSIETSLGRSPTDGLPRATPIKNDFKVLMKATGIEIAAEVVDKQGMQALIKALEFAQGILPDKRETGATGQSAQGAQPAEGKKEDDPLLS